MTTRSYENIVVETLGKVRTVGINRPEHRNAVNISTAQELLRAFREFDADDSLHCAVLYGRGGTFCAGYDLKELAAADGTVVESLKEGYVEGEGPGPLVR